MKVETILKILDPIMLAFETFALIALLILPLLSDIFLLRLFMGIGIGLMFTRSQALRLKEKLINQGIRHRVWCRERKECGEGNTI